MYLKILASLFVALVVLFKTSTNAADADLWGYLAFGRLFFQGSGFPYHDVFAYTPTYDIWVYHEWLTGVVYYFLYDLLGMDSLQLLKHAISLTFSYCIFKTARLRGANFAFALVAVLLASFALSWYRSVLRAQYITMVFSSSSFIFLRNPTRTTIGVHWCFSCRLCFSGATSTADFLSALYSWPDTL